MNITFDTVKDIANRKKHGISLGAAAHFEWDTALEREDDRFDYGETRFVALGFIESRLHVLVFAEGGDEQSIRAISLRQAEKQEMRFYYGEI